MEQIIYDTIKPQVLALCQKAQKEHFVMYQDEITGPWDYRLVSVLWDDGQGLFEAHVSYSRGWPHTHYAYGYTAESLVRRIAEIIK